MYIYIYTGVYVGNTNITNFAGGHIAILKLQSISPTQKFN